MVNPLKFIASFFLILKASGFQGQGKFEKVIELANKAKSFSPKSKMILEMSYTFLCDDYCRIGKHDKAIEECSNALILFPNNNKFHRLMVDALAEKGEPIKKAIPYIRKYLDTFETCKGEFPKIMKIFFRIFKKNFDLDAYGKKIGSWNDEWVLWAKKTLENFENK